MEPSNVSLETTPRNQRQENSNPDDQGAPQGREPVVKGVPVADKPEKKLSLAELFATETDEESDADESLSDDAGDPKKPVDSIDALTKRLKITPEQAYAIKIPMPNGAEALTLGQLKDRVGEVVDLDQRELQFDQRRIKQEGELLKTQNELRELIGMIPRDQIKPEMVNKMRKQHETVQARERELTLEHIQAWQDEGKRTEEITGITKWLSEDYGFGPEFLTTVVDHRALKFIRDQYVRNERIKAALAKVVTPDNKGNRRPSGKAAKGAVRPDAREPRAKAGDDTQRSRIMALLNKSE